MTVEQLREVLAARPFRPFTLELADGNKVRVKSSEFVMPSKSGRTIAVAISEDAFRIIDLLLVVSIHVGNGHSPRSRYRRRR